MIVALVSDTGMRLSETVGLAYDDLRVKDQEIPHVIVQNHPWRRLKTKGIERRIPLVEASLWAAQSLQTLVIFLLFLATLKMVFVIKLG